MISSTPEVLTQIGMIKGWLYVLLTALLLYNLVRRGIKELELSQKALLQAKECGGTVTVHSESGAGSAFSVYLPAITNIAEVTPDTVEPIPGGSERILFVDDEEILVEMWCDILENLGYTVTATTESTKALELFLTRPDQFDLVITDMTMPGMTGIDLSKEILGLRPAVPIILCTGFSELITEEKARAMGIRGFAMKPLSLRRIANLIREVLEEKEC